MTTEIAELISLIALFVLSVFVVHRVTNLIVLDNITEPAREALFRWLLRRRQGWRRGLAAWLHDLLSCVFCVGVWVSLGLSIATFAVGPVASLSPVWFYLMLWWWGLAGAETLLRSRTAFLFSDDDE